MSRIFSIIVIFNALYLVNSQDTSDSNLDVLKKDIGGPSERLKNLIAIGFSEHPAYEKLTSDRFLRKFLIARNDDPREALKLINGYLQLRKSHPEFFMNMTQLVQKFGTPPIAWSYETSKSGQNVLFTRVGVEFDLKNHKLGELCASLIPIQELMAENNVMSEKNDGSQKDCDKKGIYHIIADYERLGSVLNSLLSPSEIMLCSDIVYNMPVTPDKIHVINQDMAFNLFYSFAKLFIDDNVINKVILHGSDPQLLYNYVEPRFLPKEAFGDGQLREYTQDELNKLDMQLNDIWSGL